MKMVDMFLQFSAHIQSLFSTMNRAFTNKGQPFVLFKDEDKDNKDNKDNKDKQSDMWAAVANSKERLDKLLKRSEYASDSGSGFGSGSKLSRLSRIRKV